VSAARRAGFTVVEVVIAAALLATLIALAMGVMGTTAEHVADNTVQNDLRAQGAATSILLQRELRSVSRSDLELHGIDPSTGLYTEARFRVVTDFNETTGQPDKEPASPLYHSIVFEYEPTETSNGVDDDGDGLIDEGSLVLYRSGTKMAELAARVRGTSVAFKFATPAPPLTPIPWTPVAGDTTLEMTFMLQQRGRQPGVLDTHQVEFLIGLRN
jgi:hypothetical protein